MPKSKVQIASAALSSYCGTPRISSLDEDNKGARLCKLHYEDALAAVLEAHDWRFATGRARLALLANDRSEWAYRYDMPNAALTLRWVNEPATARRLLAANQHPDTPREFGVGCLYSDVAGAVAEFTRAMDDPSVYSQAFCDAVSAELAARIVKQMTEDAQAVSRTMAARVETLEQAVLHDYRQRPTEDFSGDVPSWLAERGV